MDVASLAIAIWRWCAAGDLALTARLIAQAHKVLGEAAGRTHIPHVVPARILDFIRQRLRAGPAAASAANFTIFHATSPCWAFGHPCRTCRVDVATRSKSTADGSSNSATARMK